mmetsp:Transcript_73896/g.128160  ORF Transcript_73896/g.128160 Transcript_73896/m.128160 type:complete len:241 (-) Transcript_73896:65-787(-)
MASAQLIRGFKEWWGATLEYKTALMPIPSPSSMVALGKSGKLFSDPRKMGQDVFEVLNYWQFWIGSLYVMFSQLMLVLQHVIRSLTPPFVNVALRLTIEVAMAFFFSYSAWFLIVKKHGEQIPGPFAVFGKWWVFLLGILQIPHVIGFIFLLQAMVTGFMSVKDHTFFEMFYLAMCCVFLAFNALLNAQTGAYLISHNDISGKKAKVKDDSAPPASDAGRPPMRTSSARSSTPPPTQKSD